VRGAGSFISALLLALTVGSAAARVSPNAAPPARPIADVRLRAAPDGAGPSHLFWIAARKGEDVVGVVDPLFAAVRLYAVKRAGPGPPGPLAPRVRALGACALPIDFRVWQVHQLKGHVVLEGMPTPGGLGHAAEARDLFDVTFAIRRDIASRADALAVAGEDIDRPEWNPERAIPCGKVVSRHSRLGSARAYRATRTGRGSITLANTTSALAPRAPLTVRAAAGRLYTAQELEPAGRLRIVRTSEAAPSSDGMLRVRQRYLVFTRGRVMAAFAFDDARARGKLGQRPVAVMPTGEVLAMGLTGDDRFGLTSCGRATAPTGLCRLPEEGLSGAPAGPAMGAKAAPGTLTAARLFVRVRPVVRLRWQADASALPADCRAAEGCAVRGQAARFVPLTGLRLSRGLYRRTGMAYAQAGDGLAAAARFEQAAADGAFTAALRRAHEGRGGLPGNLADGLTGDLGIDCSALIQLAWAGNGARERLTTLRLQSGPIAYGCPSRLPGPEHLRAGDAIALNVGGLMEHAVLFAEPLSADGASEAWLVLEAASGCGGVCWSLYDPGFFNGWGLYRAAGRRDRPCPAAPASASLTAAPIPRDRAGWLRMLRAGP
jgi:cell wall-associated NlpC family hydrolase